MTPNNFWFERRYLMPIELILSDQPSFQKLRYTPGALESGEVPRLYISGRIGVGATGAPSHFQYAGEEA